MGAAYGCYGGPDVKPVRINLHDDKLVSGPADSWWEGPKYR